MRPIKILEGFNEMTEQFGFALGEVDDWLDRNEPLVPDLIDKVAAGKISPADAKRLWRAEITNARQQMEAWRTERAMDAFEYKYKHLNQTLFPFVRVVARLPKETA